MKSNSSNDEMIQLLEMRSMAFVEGDIGFFECFLADDFIYTNASGNGGGFFLIFGSP